MAVSSVRSSVGGGGGLFAGRVVGSIRGQSGLLLNGAETAECEHERKAKEALAMEDRSKRLRLSKRKRAYIGFVILFVCRFHFASIGKLFTFVERQRSIMLEIYT